MTLTPTRDRCRTIELALDPGPLGEKARGLLRNHLECVTMGAALWPPKVLNVTAEQCFVSDVAAAFPADTALMVACHEAAEALRQLSGKVAAN